MPLYYWYKDTKAGDTNGQAVGNVWYVLGPDGKPNEAGAEASINIATDPKLGQILVGENGMTLYMFTKDTANTSNCDADCLKKWPALITQGKPILGDGVDASMVGTATLADGSKIVTYNSMPLYYWYKDTKAGETNGQAVGNVWYVLGPDGNPVGMEAASVSGTPAAGSGAANATAPAGEATINIATDPKLGQILVDANGMTLYIFTNDAPDKSNCNGDCLKNWPPLLTQGKPVLGAGVDDSKVGMATLADGSNIVTYNHMPLYYFVKDTKAGDVTGQGVGSVWYVISPDGEIIGQ
jgi:predicted lipoprotein with Yx(FWY)xxD motif